MASRLDSVTNWNKLAADANFRVMKLAKDCGISERQLRRYFLKNFGKSPRAWMAAARMGHVRSLLTTATTVKEISVKAGFNHQSSLSRSFKQHYKATPSSQRRSAQVGAQ
jgi:AraC family transcriptional regulator, transcriptional activator FtrA